MFARKFSSDGRMRWPAPCRARNATRLPRSVPITYGPDGLAERRRDGLLLAVGQLRHVAEAAAADDDVDARPAMIGHLIADKMKRAHYAKQERVLWNRQHFRRFAREGMVTTGILVA